MNLEQEIKKLKPYIKIIANRYRGLGVPVEDLMQEGIIGVFKAQDHFDSKRNVKFSSYAIWWIRQSILNAVNTQGRLVHLPFGKINLFRKIKILKELYNKKYHREPTDIEIKKELQIDGIEYNKTLLVNSTPLHINEEIDDESEATFEKFFASDDNVEDNVDKIFIRDLLNKVLDSLTERERFIIKNFFGLENKPILGLEEIGDELNLTRERCRQIKKEALKKIKEELLKQDELFNMRN